MDPVARRLEALKIAVEFLPADDLDQILRTAGRIAEFLREPPAPDGEPLAPPSSP
jgi:hypothetical protein